MVSISCLVATATRRNAASAVAATCSPASSAVANRTRLRVIDVADESARLAGVLRDVTGGLSDAEYERVLQTHAEEIGGADPVQFPHLE